jgi:SAM-dependent methyltransferase
MGKGAPLRWIENRRLAHYLHGCGIEIGALWRRFPVPPRAKVWYVDRAGLKGLEEQYPEVEGKIVRPDLVAEATQLPFASASLDFVIASHVLEHLPFPLVALRGWYEVLAPEGVLLLKVPDKRYTFDVRRCRTPLDHLVTEHEHPELFDWQGHYAEFVENVHGRKPDETELRQAALDLKAAKFNIHYHSWIDADVREIVDYTRQVWHFNWQAVIFWNAHFYRKETVVLLLRNGR